MKNLFRNISVSPNAANMIRAFWDVQRNIFLITCVGAVTFFFTDALGDPELVAAAQAATVTSRFVWSIGVLDGLFIASLMITTLYWVIFLVGSGTILVLAGPRKQNAPLSEEPAP